MSAAALACTILSATAEVRPADAGWRETTTLEVRRDGPCDHLPVPLPDGVTLEGWEGRVRSDARKDHRLDGDGADAVRLVRGAPPADGARTWRILLPELLDGDTATVTLTRRWDRPVAWTSLDAARFVQVKAPRGVEPVPGAEADGRWWWSRTGPVGLRHPWAGTEPTPIPATDVTGLDAAAADALVAGLVVLPEAAFGAEVVAGQAALDAGVTDPRGASRTVAALVGQRDLATSYPPSVDPGPPPTFRATVTLASDDPRPLVRLRPGDGLVARETTHATWADAPAAVFLPLPDDVVAVEAGAPCRARRDRTDAVWLVAPAGATACDLHVDRRVTDAWWPLSPHLAASPVDASARWEASRATVQGAVAVEGGTVRLAAFADAVLLADADRLRRELVGRDRLAGYPEPGLPARVKLGRTGWELAIAVRDLLHERAVVRADLAFRPGQPRRVHRVLRGGVLTPEEAALVIALWLRQERVEAEVVRVHPGPGAPAGTTPNGYTEAVVRVRHDGGEAWIDPGCVGCAPLAVRAALQGRPALGAVDAVPTGLPDELTPPTP